MQNLSPTTRLKNSIQELKNQQSVDEQLLKMQLNIVFESLKPVNLLKKALRDVATSPDLINNILGSSVGLASGFLSKKVFVGFSGNVLRKLFGSMLQFGVTNLIAKNPDSIRLVVQYLVERFVNKKRPHTIKP
ncbi:MAG: hypothetical protein ACOYN4_09450 [Bacteroidales bacterium]